MVGQIDKQNLHYVRLLPCIYYTIDPYHRQQKTPLIFALSSGELIGCCGLRPRDKKQYELGFHLRPQFWGQGLAMEAAKAVIAYAFDILQAESLFAGHDPHNENSAKVLKKLGFSYVGDEFYAPTGLNHPSYVLEKKG